MGTTLFALQCTQEANDLGMGPPDPSSFNGATTAAGRSNRCTFNEEQRIGVGDLACQSMSIPTALAAALRRIPVQSFRSGGDCA